MPLTNLSLASAAPGFGLWPAVLLAAAVVAVAIPLLHQDTGWLLAVHLALALLLAGGAWQLWLSSRAGRRLLVAQLDQAQGLQALAQAGLAAWEHDLQRGVVLLSPEAARLFDERFPTDRPTELTPGETLRRLHPDDAARVRDALRRTIAEGVPVVHEFRVFRANGEVAWLSDRARLIRDGNGRPLRLIGASQDVTARHRAESLREEDAARRRFFFDHSRDAVFVVDMQARVIEANAAFRTLTGRPDDGQPLHIWDFDLNHPRERALQAVNAEAPALQSFEAHWQRTDGGRLQVEISINRVEFDGRRVILCVARDITERKQDEQRLRKLSLAVEQGPSAVVIMDTEGRIEYVNEAYERISGYRRDEVIGRNPRLEAAREDDPDFHALMRALGPNRQGWTGERIERRRNGEAYHERLTVLPLRLPDGSVTHYVAIEEDITERKRIEAELVRHRDHLEDAVVERTRELQAAVSAHAQSELRLQVLNEQLVAARDRAESANRAKTAFLANMSHEIRTPMNAIIGLTYLLQREQRNAADAERLGKISSAAHHLLDVINDVLDLSKIESGKLRLERTPFSLDSVIERCCALMAERVRAKGLALVVDGHGAPASLVGDPTRLSQALLNLLSNAVKFTERGSVLLRYELIEAHDQALQLRFSVEDTGVGVPPDKLDVLFEAFEQADSSTTRRFGGSGLGLAITRRLVGLMDGEVSVQSEVGRGSCFGFNAWFGRDRRHEPVAARAGDPRLAGLRVLLVEGLALAREAQLRQLRHLGLQVDAVAGASEALALLAATPVAQRHDLLLCEWPLTLAEGASFTLAQLQRAGRHSGLVVLPLAATDSPAERLAAARAGFAEPLAKPVLPARLRERLLQLLLPALPSRAPAAPSAPRRPDFGGALVLLAEDNSINQEVAAQLLQAVGLRVELSDNGHDALRRAAETPYAMILMDVQMPGLDGLQATQQIRALPLHTSTPILAMTANAFGDDRARCLEAGMNDHIAKPVDPRVLYDTIARWLPAPAGAATPTRLADPAPGPSAIPGLTMSRALLYLPGRDEVFVRVLQQFADNYAEGLPTLAQHLQQGEPEVARRLVHALRGACGAIGATALLEQAQSLEQLLVAGGPLPALVNAGDALQRALLGLVHDIRRHTPVLRAGAVQSPSAAALAAACEELSALLARADFAANARLRELAPLLRAGFGVAALQRVEEALRRYDHEAALAALQSLPQLPARAA